MKKTFFNVLIFTTGAAIGSMVTWKILKDKYERIVQEEIDSVKETWARMNDDSTGDADDEPETQADENTNDAEENDDEWSEQVMTDYSALTRKYNRSLLEETDEEGGRGEEVPHLEGPKVIKPEDYGDGNFDHDLYCITYYADGVLADDWWTKLNIDKTIGRDALNHFGDYVDDVVHVRNERIKADYEVTLDPRRYADVVANNPLAPTYAD